MLTIVTKGAKTMELTKFELSSLLTVIACSLFLNVVFFKDMNEAITNELKTIKECK